MKREQALELQAYLDGELSGREARRIEEWLAAHPESAGLVSEMKWAKATLEANEPALVLPESRPFYWSKIEREISRTKPEPSAVSPWFRWLDPSAWRKLLAPISGLALAALLVAGTVKFYSFTAPEHYPRFLAQVESPSEEVGAFSFRSQEDNVFVIWLYNRPVETRSDLAMLNEMVIQ
jgi:anti-sigma factor RsiW